MNRIITDNASLTKKQPLVANAGTGSIPFLEDGVQEALWNLFLGMVGSYTPGDVMVLEGLVITLSNSNNTATWTAGRVAYNSAANATLGNPGEIYSVAAGTSTKSSGVFLYSLSNTFSGTLDPIYFSDSSTASVHQIRQITITHGTSGTGIADYGGATVKAYSGKPTSMTLNSGYSIASGKIAKYSIGPLGQVRLSFSVNTSGSQAPGGIITTIPVTPAHEVQFVGVDLSSSPAGHMLIAVETGGNIRAQNFDFSPIGTQNITFTGEFNLGDQ